MKTYVCLFLAATSLSVFAADAPTPAPTAPVTVTNGPAPKIQFADLVHDFGKVNGGEVVKCEFIFTNTGDALLEIADVRPSCGCTTTGQFDKKVEPGKTGKIPLQFNTGTYNGAVTKTATVTCNDPKQPSVMLQLRATIWRALEVTPQFAILNLTSEAPSNATTVRIVNNLDTPLSVFEPESKNPQFALDLITNQPGKEYALVIRTVPPFPTANIQSQVSVKTSSSNMPVVSVTAWANVQQTVMAMPAQVTLPAGALTNGMTQTVWVRNNGTNNLTVSQPAVNATGVDAQIKEFQPGKYFSVNMTFPAGFLVPAGQKTELTVKTSHPQYPEIKVPIIQPQVTPMPVVMPVPGTVVSNTPPSAAATH